jgi:beta-lactamase regulating signal transducer with metallopeptidase domain
MSPFALPEAPLVAALGWALVHFLWQGALIALVLALAGAAFPRADARVRYSFACGALALMVASAIGTFAWLWAAPSGGPLTRAGELAAVGAGLIASAVERAGASSRDVHTGGGAWLQCLDALWLAGVIALSARSMLGWVAAQRLRHRNTSPVDPAWEQRAGRLAAALGVSRPVRLAASMLASVPTVIGWFRPLILLPAGALAGVDARQIEALLAHELAHIRRHDYLVNLLQTAAETLLFYHPAVWWVGRRIRVEREHCCDDLAVAACGDVLTYARALTALEERRASGSQFAMAAGGGSLLGRIRRLISPGRPAPERDAATWFEAILVILAVVGLLTGSLVARGQAQAANGPAPRQAASAPAPGAQPGSFIDALADAGYKDLTVDQLIAFKIHDVTPAYILDLRTAGLTGLTPDQLIAFKIHSVTPSYIADLRAAGLTDFTADQLVALKIHGVTPEFVRALKAAGVTKLTADDVVAARIHTITPEMVLEAVKMGLKDLSIDRLVHLFISKTPAASRN